MIIGIIRQSAMRSHAICQQRQVTGTQRMLHRNCCLLFRRGMAQDTVQQYRKTVISSKKKLPKNYISPSAYALLIIPIGSFGLGWWQVKRLKWKQELIDKLKSQTAKPPVPLPEDLAELEHMEYQKVSLRGEFDHSRELYVMPRQPVDRKGYQSGGLISSQSQIGAFVITPFTVADRKEKVLVNRGWVQRNQLDPRTRPEGQITGEVEITAIVRHPEKKSRFGSKNDPTKNEWFNKDTIQMSEVLGTEPVMLDAVKECTVRGGPLGGQTTIELRNEHLTYIMTWWTLSFISGGMWYSIFWKLRR